MRYEPAASGERFFAQPRGRLAELRVGVRGAWEAGKDAQRANDGAAASAAGARQIRVLGGKVGYYTDFILYGMLVVALVAFTLRGRRSDQLIWLAAAMAGAGGWTLLEYLLHRFVFHRMPLIAELHHVHHAAPRSYVGTPTWASLLILTTVFFVPFWRLFSLNIAFGAITGLIMGWLWYGIVHHVIHHRRPRRLAIALKVASHRHFLHHSPYVCGNFGVTTALWDYVFGTHISSQTRAVNAAVPRIPRLPAESGEWPRRRLK
jgi:sterol desaturase/sphingolipid hydroxylase (fatty acid hydroxylase superfamily)